jgi:hypothetical protein
MENTEDGYIIEKRRRAQKEAVRMIDCGTEIERNNRKSEKERDRKRD